MDDPLLTGSEQDQEPPTQAVQDPSPDPARATSMPAAAQDPVVQDPPRRVSLQQRMKESMARIDERRQQQQLHIFQEATKSNPDIRAEAQSVARQLGVDPDTAERNLDVMRGVAKKQTLRDLQLDLYNPVLAERLRDIEFARIAHDDLKGLTEGERIIGAFRSGYMMAELGELNNKKACEVATPEELRRLDFLTERMKKLPQGTGVVGGTSQVLGQMAATLPRALAVGSAHGLAAAGAMTMVGQVPPLTAVPEELATVPAAAITAFTYGFATDMARSTFLMESGLAYAEMVKNGYDHRAAASASQWHGVVSMGLEMVPLSIIGKPVKQALMREVRQKVARDLMRPTSFQAIKGFALKWAEAGGAEVGTEVLQKVSEIVAEEAARTSSKNPDKLSSTISRGEVVDTLVAEGIQAAQSMLLLAGFGPTVNLASTMRHVAEAERTHKYFLERSKNAAESKLRERAPDAYAEHQEALSPGETVYISADQFAETLGQSDADREQLANSMPEVAAQLDAAIVSGEDITMPMSQFAARLAGTPLGDAMIPHMRTDPMGLSAFQAKQVRAQQGRMVQEASDLLDEFEVSDRAFYESSERVWAGMRDQLLATGKLDKAAAATSAKLYQAFVVTQAQKLKIAPEAFEQRYMLRVVGEGQDAATLRPDPLRDQARSDASVLEHAEPVGAVETGDGQAPQAPEPDILHQPAGEPGGPKKRRGSFDTKRFVALLHDNGKDKADLSTFLHEAGHYFLQVYVDMATSAEATPAMQQDLAALLGWFQVKDLEAWNALSFEKQRRHHEAFAASFESYLFDGKAPSLEMQSLFDKFASWLRGVYRTLLGINRTYRQDQGVDLPVLSAEVRGVFDRMLASEDSIKQAREARGMVSDWKDRETMTPDEAAAHEQLEEEAIDAAHADLNRRSLDQMRLLSGARSKILAAKQKESMALREQIKAEVEDEVRRSPVERARAWVKDGRFVNPDGIAELGDVEENHKLATDAVEALVPGAAAKLRGAVRKDGMSPDTVAAMFGFDAGDELVRALVEIPAFDEHVRIRTDRRMLLEHAQFVPGTAEHVAAVDLALHNDARKRLLAASMRHLAKGKMPVNQMLRAAKEAAKALLEQKPIGQIHASIFAAAARRAGMNVREALAAGDEAKAVDWLGRQLLQTELVGMAAAVREEFERGNEFMGLFARPDEKLVKTRDIDFVRAGRALAAAYSLGPAISSAQEQFVRTAITSLAETAPDLHARVTGLLATAKHFRNIRLRDFRDLIEAAETLWTGSREQNILNAEGRRVELRNAVGELATQVQSLPPRNVPGTSAKDKQTPTRTEVKILAGWNVWASLKRFDHWVRFMDGGKHGAFATHLYDPIQRAVQSYQKEKDALIRKLHPRFMQVFRDAGARWDSAIVAKELGGFRFKGLKEVLGAILHMGTQSNYEKLLGDHKRQWGDVRDIDGEIVVDDSRWQAFLQRMHDEGILKQEHWQFAKFVWDTYRELLPRAQATHRKVYFYEFEAIATREVQTPWGPIQGGYVPARADPNEMKTPRLASVEASMEGLEQRFQFSVSAPRSFSLKRNPYYREPLSLDLGRQLQHMDEELRFIELQPVVKDALRITRHRDFSTVVGAYDREAITGIIQPMVESAAKQSTVRPSDSKLMDAAGSLLTHAGSLVMLGFNAINGIVQLTGLSNARAEVSGRYWRAGINLWRKSPREAMADARARSQVFARRQDTLVRKLGEDIQRLSEQGPISRGFKAVQQTAGRAAFFLQRMFQGVSDTVTWQGAYQQALAEDQSLTPQEAEQNAVRHADGVLKRAQGSADPHDAAAYETGTPLKKSFTQFMSYSNVVLNQIISSQPGSRLKTFAWVLILPALMEGTLRMALLGGPEDDEGDGLVDDVAKQYGRSVARNVAGLVPIVGPGLMALAEEDAGRVLSSPGATVLESAARGLWALPDLFLGQSRSEPGKGDISGAEARAIATLVTLMTGISFSPVGRAAGYVEDVKAGKRKPANAADYARGVIIGR